MKIYYATVVEGEESFGRMGSTWPEPVRAPGQAPLGYEIEPCCNAMASAFGHDLTVSGGSDGAPPKLILQTMLMMDGRRSEAHYCPFCGDRVELVSHLKLRVEQFEVTHEEYRYIETAVS
jgi:hypothetical protein